MITAADRLLVNSYVDTTLRAYKRFMQTNSMPHIAIVPFEISLDATHNQGYGVPASHNYDPQNDTHTLKLMKDIYNPVLHADYLVYHELTHAYDVHRLARGDKMKYASLRGYIEYHAAQVDLLKQLGAKTIDQKISFSMNDAITSIGKESSVIHYLNDLHLSLTNLILKTDFPDSLETLSVAIGMIFNHLGHISICSMFARDYDEYKSILEDMSIEESFIGKTFPLLRGLSSGFMSQIQISVHSTIYFQTIMTLVTQMENAGHKI